MSKELLKAWVHNVLQNPIDEHQLAHAEITKELIEQVEFLLEAQKQWEPQWFNEAAANAAGYNESLDKIKSLESKLAKAREALEKIASPRDWHIDLFFIEIRPVIMIAREALKEIE